MKPILFLIFLITATTTITVAQSRTRDVLFPHFAEDKAKMDAKAAKEKETTPAPKQTGRSTKEAIFTNYQSQSATQKAKPLAAQSRKQSKTLPSDMSAQAALEKEKAKNTTATTPALTLPTQGEEPKTSSKATTGQLKKQ